MAKHPDPTLRVETTEQALQLLKQGNQRFVSGKMAKPTHLKSLVLTATQQNPFAAVLLCADSRCIAEVIFDKGIGNLFVVRNAGNIADSTCIGSFQFAVNVLGCQIVVVVGHTNCGAITNAYNTQRVDDLKELQDIIDNIVDIDVPSCDSVYDATVANVRHQVSVLQKAKGITVPVYGCVYCVASGVVEWLDTV